MKLFSQTSVYDPSSYCGETPSKKKINNSRQIKSSFIISWIIIMEDDYSIGLASYADAQKTGRRDGGYLWIT